MRLAERTGFEPVDGFPSPAFEAGALNRALPSFHGAQQESRTLRHLTLNQAALPICVAGHIQWHWHSRRGSNHSLQIRSLTLYPVELREHMVLTERLELSQA